MRHGLHLVMHDADVSVQTFSLLLEIFGIKRAIVSSLFFFGALLMAEYCPIGFLCVEMRTHGEGTTLTSLNPQVGPKLQGMCDI